MYYYSKSLTLQAKVTYMKSEPIDVFIATPGAFKKFLTYGRTSTGIIHFDKMN